MTSHSSSGLPAIRVEHLYKRFVQNEQQQTLRQNATRLLMRLGRRTPEPVEEHPFWALHDINFTVNVGERVGVLGHNGAGKTTLLRILSRITSATKGHVEVNGRFATLIALGAGFNAEMTGRENIYLNAAIQGATLKQIDAIMPEIIEFSELQAFIDLPVKRYSTGMTARLGFSIAIHILPDMLFLDEVLSVGDIAFQNKCKERLNDLILRSDKPRTLIFVSHGMESVRSLCTRCLWLNGGHLMMDGPSDDVIRAYQAAMGITDDTEVEAPVPDQSLL